MFEDVDYISMPLDKLKARGTELAELDEIPRQGASLARIRREMSMVCFELVIKEQQLEKFLAGEDVEIEL